MNKPAETERPIHALLQGRWSPRAFSSRIVEPDKLLRLFEAARWSPSGGNTQPWAFIVVTRADGAILDQLVAALMGRNPLWAGNAPVLALSVAKPSRPGTPINRFSYYDVGQAVAHLSLQAEALGLRVHQMAGYDASKARALFNLPEETEPMTLIAIGYEGSVEDLHTELRERETERRTRKPINEFVFGGGWDQPLRLAEGESAEA